jgi:hypothetical protein
MRWALFVILAAFCAGLHYGIGRAILCLVLALAVIIAIRGDGQPNR